MNTVTETAQGTALAIDRRAREAGEANRRDAVAAGYRVVEQIKGLEGELNTLMRMVGSEADGLRAKLDRSRLLSVSAGRSARTPMLEGAALTEERNNLGIAPAPKPEVEKQPVVESEAAEEPPAEEPPAEEPAAEEPAAEEPAAEEPAAEEPAAEEPPAEEPAAEEPAAEEPREPLEAGAGEEEEETPVEPFDAVGEQQVVESEAAQEWAADDQSAFLEVEEGEEGEGADEELAVDPSEAASEQLTGEDREDIAHQSREDPHALIAGTSDQELAEVYSRAKSRAGAGRDDDEASYWAAVIRATVEEALSRPDFGQPMAEGLSGGRKVKKQRAKVLQPLLAAREGALSGEPASAAAPPVPQSPSIGEGETENDVEPQDPVADIEQQGLEAEVEPQELEADIEPQDPGESLAKGEGRWGPLRKLSRRERPFVDVAGECAVCRRSFKAESSEALAESGWLVKGSVGLCPDDQAQGWQLAEGSHLPYQLGSAG